jgi:large subunit ribosomal protein L17
MRHQKSRHRLTQKPDHARMMERNLLTSVLLYEVVRTTKQRAKVVRPLVDRAIATAKRQEPQRAVRVLNAMVTDRNASRKVMEVFVNRYKNRTSGFTRVTPAGYRSGDGAEMVDIVLIDAEVAAAPGAKTQTEKVIKKEKKAKATKSAKAS